MAITQAMATSFKAEILDEQHDLVRRYYKDSSLYKFCHY